MVKAVLAPKSIENWFIKRVEQGYDEGLVEEVLTPVGTDILRVCLCMDGAILGASSHDSVLAGLKQLFNGWGVSVQIEISSFTFVGTADPAQEAAMMQLLNEASLFYFCGIYEMTDALRHALTVSPLVQHLRTRIQYNQMSFFGVSKQAVACAAYPCGEALFAYAFQAQQDDLRGSVSGDTAFELCYREAYQKDVPATEKPMMGTQHITVLLYHLIEDKKLIPQDIKLRIQDGAFEDLHARGKSLQAERDAYDMWIRWFKLRVHEELEAVRDAKDLPTEVEVFGGVAEAEEGSQQAAAETMATQLKEAQQEARQEALQALQLPYAHGSHASFEARMGPMRSKPLPGMSCRPHKRATAIKFIFQDTTISSYFKISCHRPSGYLVISARPQLSRGVYTQFASTTTERDQQSQLRPQATICIFPCSR